MFIFGLEFDFDELACSFFTIKEKLVLIEINIRINLIILFVFDFI